MKYVYSLLFSLLFLLACTSEDNSIPEGVLSQEKMVTILADIHFAESVVSSRELSKDTSLYLYRALEQQIFEKEGITKEDFVKSYTWYVEHIESFKSVYTQVVDTLSVRSSVGQ